jgi:predicted MFS family arabinose efflux permease
VALEPKDNPEKRRFDLLGSPIIAVALGTLAWALSQIGVPRSSSSSVPHAATLVAAGLGVAGIGLYAWWERVSDLPMTPPRLGKNRAFVGLNAATLLIYSGLSIMFFLVPFDIVDRRGMPSIEAGLTFLPFTAGVGLLSQPFGRLADTFGSRAMLIAGPVGAGVAYIWMALGHDAGLTFGLICPMALLGISFAVLVAPLTASVMSSVAQSDEGLASGINNAASRIAQLAGVAIAAGVGSLTFGYQYGLLTAAALTVAGALTVGTTTRPESVK